MLTKLYQHLFCQPRMARRITVAAVSNIVIGMCIAFFEKVQVGTDPCTVLTSPWCRRCCNGNPWAAGS